jgi:hypothetical protein
MEESDQRPTGVPAGLEYATPLPARPRGGLGAFFAFYCAGGFCSAYATDVALNVGRRSDGGCFVIGLYAVGVVALPAGVAFLVRGGRMPAWVGAAVGVAVPPLVLGLLFGTSVI